MRRKVGAHAEVDVTGAVCTVRFTLPEVRNPLTTPVMFDLADVVRHAGDDPAVRVVVITGSGAAFCSGMDLREPAGGEHTGDAVRAANELVAAITLVPRPVVAVVNGVAAGVGVTIALACDLVVAKRSASFLLAFVHLGLLPDGGATALVPAAIGRVRAARLAMLGERLPAAEAFEWGLISHVVEDEDYEDAVSRLTAQLAAGPTKALAEIKAALHATTLPSLSAAQEREEQRQFALSQTEDFRTGLQAFHAKGTPRFVGR